MRIAFAFGVCSLVVGCSSPDSRPEPTEEPLTRVDLRAAFGSDSIDPIGLAIAPDGTRFIFDESRGLYRLDGDRAVEVVPMSAMPNPGPAAPLQLPVTDLVALSPDLFALTAIGDGYLLDTSAMTLTQHFCYLPEGTPTNFTQRTDALAFDAAAGRLYAQPMTYDENGAFQFGQVAAYDRGTGTDVNWFSLAGDVPVTGMLAHNGGLVLGQEWRLSRFDLATQTVTDIDELGRFGVLSIDGLAIDPVANTLVVIDRRTDALLDIELSKVTLE
ncbi:MAG TPA: hypothetical protein VM513_16735 [Kofleriaceae bacterium]|jgi:hypothetical protein|nr:hypothetical protein [Kofleriaceae bacterium]